jgi:hypothetical protein
MEKIFNIIRTEKVLSLENAELIGNAINNGDLDTCDLFEDFVTYVSENANVDYNTLMDFQEHYENLRSHEENLKTLLTR